MKALPASVLLVSIGAAVGLGNQADAAQRRASHAPARPPATRMAAAHLTPPLVVFGDRTLGTDPDVFIRQQLLRDLGAVFGGGM